MEDTPMESPRGESSKEGLRRMQRLAAHARAVGAMSRGMVHPSSGLMVYPAPAEYAGHVISPLYSAIPPRSLPTPPVLGPSREICSSPDGRWIIIFHPTLPTLQGDIGGGTIAIYSSEILLPYTTSATVIPHSTLPLPRCPLAITPLYPSRTYTTGGIVPPSGPHPPPSHDPTKGPVLAVLLPDGVLLIHPHKLPTGNWGMNVLKTSLETRSYVRTGDPSPISGMEARRGWMGLVPGNQDVWASFEIRGEVKVVKVDVGTDENGRWFLMTTPMPSLPELGLDQEDRQLQGAVFTSLSAEQRRKAYPEVEGAETDSNVETETVGLVIISQDSTDNTARTRMDLVGFERREVTLVEGFGEMTGQSDAPVSWDWFSIPKIINSTTSPSGTTLLEISPTSSSSSECLALALLSAPRGVVLTHIALAADSAEDDGSWSTLRGDEVVLGDIDVEGMVPSQSAVRGGMGLVGVLTEQGMMLVLSPSGEVAGLIDPPIEPSDRASNSLLAAMKEGTDWSDVVRAVQGSVEPSDLQSTVHSILQRVHEAIQVVKGRDEIQQLSPVQVALYGLYDMPRRDIAADLGKLSEASRLFTSVASHKDGIVSFELDHVWDLVFISEWVYATIAKIFTEVVNERGRIEWGIQQPASLSLIYVLNPLPRTLLCRILAQLKAFATFVQSLSRPILPPESHFSTNTPLTARSVQAALMAKDRVKGMSGRYGVSILSWGKALVTLHKAKPKVTEEDISSFLRLTIDLTSEELGNALAAIPAPSSLFAAEQPAERYDAISFLPLPKPVGARCDRCGSYTLSVIKRAAVASTSGEDGMKGWKEARRGVCGCGGTWVRG